MKINSYKTTCKVNNIIKIIRENSFFRTVMSSLAIIAGKKPIEVPVTGEERNNFNKETEQFRPVNRKEKLDFIASGIFSDCS